MRYFTSLVILLIGYGPISAQIPKEEYFPFRNAYEEEYQPMITTDSALFYRAIQVTGDLFDEATDFKFSFTAYKRRGEPYRPDGLILNGIRLSSRYTSPLQALYIDRYNDPNSPWQLPSTAADRFQTDGEAASPSKNASLQFSGRNYLVGLRFSMVENLGRSWEIAAALQTRTGRDLYTDGVFSNTLSVGMKAVKKFRNQHTLSLILVVPPSMRSLRSSSTKEAYALTGDPLYNPSWGYQDGKMRSARIRREIIPLAAAVYHLELSDATALTLSVTTEAGVKRHSSLAWYNAQTPLPDNYRAMPSYQTDPTAQLSLENIWRANDSRYTQIDWDELYQQNRMAGGEAAYAVEDRVERIGNLQFLAEGTTLIGERLTLRYGIHAARRHSRFYKEMRDLLGGAYIVDLDQYLVDDDSYSNMLQNNLRDPNRIIREGGHFGYDYSLTYNEIGICGALEYQANRLRMFFSANLEEGTFRRQGYYEKELFPGDRSYGRSRTLHFTPFLLRASLGYSFAARHYLETTLSTSARTPDGDDLFLNPEYNNRPVDDPKTEREFAAEVSYTWTGRTVRFQMTLFATRTSDATEVRRYYDDASSAFSNLVCTGNGTLRYGAEATALIRLAYRWNLTLAASIGRYRYANNPRVSVYADTDNTSIDRDAESYMGDCVIGGTPQITGFTGLNYYGPKGWGFKLDASYAGSRYVDPAPLRRTARIARQLSESPEAFDLFTRQERLGDAFSLDATLFKSFYFTSSRLTLMFAIRNILSAKDQIFSGYESLRVRRIRTGDTYIYRPMDTRYMYAYPRTFYLSLFFKF